MIPDYIAPEFLQNSDAETIHQRMMEQLPDDIDKSEGGYVYDFTKPTALEHARVIEFSLNESIKLIWPMFATGIYLDYHGEHRGLPRKAGIPASGQLVLEGDEGTIIHEGDLFSTESKNGIANVEYKSLETYTIPANGSITIDIACIEVGIVGNTAPNTIIMKSTHNDGISSVTNPKEISGGIEIEEDEDYRERLVEFDRVQGLSYVGSMADYKRWANNVNGVGEATVIPAQDDTGLVTIVITDGNGNPATEMLCEQVYNYIMRPNSPIERLAPVNALLRVIPPQTMNITISATIELKKSTIEAVKEEFLTQLRLYLQTAAEDQEIRYTQIGKILGGIFGVYDYKDLTVNNGVSNVVINSGELPVVETDNLIFISGTVD